MVVPRPSSSGMQSLRRELQRKKHKTLAPKPPVTKKTSAPPPPPPHDGASNRIQNLRPRPPPEEVRSPTISGSGGTHAPPDHRPRPHASTSPSSAASASRALPSRSGSSSARSTSAAMLTTSGHLKPGTRAGVRTRTQMKIDGKTLVLWLAATVVSATDGGYEVIYDGNLPRDNPFSTVHVPLHHVRPFNWSPPKSQPPTLSAAAIKTSAPKNQGTQQPVPTTSTAGKSLRLTRDLALETKKPATRPTTAGKSIHVIRSIMKCQDAYCLGYQQLDDMHGFLVYDD